MVAVLNWLLIHWYVFFFLSVFGVFEGIRDFFISIAEAVAGVFAARHDHPPELTRATAPTPGLCVHRRVKQIRDVRDELVGWLCIGCDTRLPPDWAVAAEDLPEGKPDA